jgi:hypothetical protein
MSTPKDSSTIQTRIDNINIESANFIGGLEKELATAKEQRFTAEYQSQLETQIAQARASYDGLLNRLEGELSTARETEIRAAAEKQAEQTRTAAETKEQIKAQLKARWIEAHGDLDVFEAQFPQLYAEEITSRATNKMVTGADRAHTRVISNF